MTRPHFLCCRRYSLRAKRSNSSYVFASHTSERIGGQNIILRRTKVSNSVSLFEKDGRQWLWQLWMNVGVRLLPLKDNWWHTIWTIEIRQFVLMAASRHYTFFWKRELYGNLGVGQREKGKRKKWRTASRWKLKKKSGNSVQNKMKQRGIKIKNQKHTFSECNKRGKRMTKRNKKTTDTNNNLIDFEVGRGTDQNVGTTTNWPFWLRQSHVANSASICTSCLRVSAVHALTTRCESFFALLVRPDDEIVLLLVWE